MKRALLIAALAVALTGARANNPNPFPGCEGRMYAPGGGEYGSWPLSYTGAVIALGTSGQIACSRFVMPCGGSFTIINEDSYSSHRQVIAAPGISHGWGGCF